MAVFGAPLPQEDHADRALAAAREMLEVRLPAFNEWLHDETGSDYRFKMGVGLNSGDFMSGNVGSQHRLEYTAIGDTINTCSRIEGLTKGKPYALKVESFRAALPTPAPGAPNAGLARLLQLGPALSWRAVATFLLDAADGRLFVQKIVGISR